MKVVLAGAFGHLGAEILKCLCVSGEHEVVAAARRETQIPECKGKYRFVKIDAEKLIGIKNWWAFSLDLLRNLRRYGIIVREVRECQGQGCTKK